MFRPLHDKVYVEQVEAETQTASGIYLPGNKDKKPCEGIVVSHGPGLVDFNGNLQKLEVYDGAKVLFQKYAGEEVEIEGKKLIMLRECDILAILED